MSRKTFPCLRDKSWLHQKYEVEKLSSVEIAKIVGCKIPSATSAIKRAGIKLRSCSEAAKDRKRTFKCEELRDREWLRQKYIDEKLNTYEIAELAGTNQRSVMGALKKYRIQTRGISESKKVQYDKNPVQSKYDELNDGEWLYQKYIEEKVSTPKIAEMLKCSEGIVISALSKNKIKVRTNQEAQLILEHESRLYDKLNDRDWLYEQYITKGLGTKEITKLAGAKTANSVRQSLIRYGIPVRSISDGLTNRRFVKGPEHRKNIYDDLFIMNYPVIEGGLLGDASLFAYNRRGLQSYPYFSKRNKYLDHIEYVAKSLFKENWSNRISGELQKKYNRIYYHLRSLSHKELKPLHEKWYPESNNFKKLVPRDLILTPEILLHWFMDDGYSCYRKMKKSTGIYAGFCSESFSKEDNEFLIEQMRNLFNLSVSLEKVKGGTGWRIHLWHESFVDFLEIIGPPPVASLAYKWKKI